MRIIENVTLDESAVGTTNATEDADEWDIGTTYDALDVVQVADAKRLYESQVGSNIGNDPTTDDGTNWIDIGPTNPWAMFDELSETQTERALNIEVEIDAPGRIDTLAFFNLDGVTLGVRFDDAVEGTVYDQTIDLISYENVDDFYDYFFAPILRKTDIELSSLPPYSNAVITIDINYPENVAKCGKLVAGIGRDLGTTIQGAEFGIIDGSKIEVDDFENLTIVERSFRKRMSLTVVVMRENVDEVGRLLATRRAIPTVFSGSDDYGQLLVDGIPREWRVSLDNYQESILTIDIEGLR